MVIEEANVPPGAQPGGNEEAIEVPAPTVWPLVLALGCTLLVAGLVTNLILTLTGLVLLLAGMAGWVWQLLPGAGVGHVWEPLAPMERRCKPVCVAPTAVETLRPSMAGHRMHLPEKIHPYSAGAKGGLLGGALMPIPALVYGVISGHGLWYPINLLAGMVMVLPRTADGQLDIAYLEQFHFGLLLLGLVIHVVISVGLGLMYGVLLPTLPGRPIFWGGVVAPLLWTGASYGFMGVLNPPLRSVIDWPSFIASQFMYGVVVGIVVVRSEKVYSSEVFRGWTKRLPARRRPERE